ncbi:MAG: glycosyltransferase family 4 protein, partial [Novosphingobium sp.]
VQPSPMLTGRWPVLTMRPEMQVFATHQVRGLIKLGRHLVTPSPRVYLAIARAALSAIARRLGVTAAWAQDRPMPYVIALPWTKADHAWLRRACRGKADIAVADYMFCAEGFDDLPDHGPNTAARIPRAIVMHDLFHARQGGAADSVALVSRDEEVALLGRADAVIAIQSAEAAFVASAVPHVQGILAPMAANPVAAPQPGIDGSLLFVGSNTAPNVVGLQWFFDEVWPDIRAAHPGAHLDVAGTVARAFPQGGPPGVSFLGLVDDLGPLYRSAGVVISPLTFGSGLKIKLVEALAMGKAVVATPVTLQGIEDVCAGAVRVAENSSSFAEATTELLSHPDRRTTLAECALAVARDHFSAAASYAQFTAWLRIPPQQK